jgi:hypothetical protein
MRIDQFRATKTYGALPDVYTESGDFGPNVKGFTYLESYCIEDRDTWTTEQREYSKETGRYYLVIGNCEYISDDLAKLESILFQFCADEFTISNRELLDMIARSFMVARADLQPMSLDEWLLEHTSKLTESERKQGAALLARFSEYGGNDE